MESKISQTTEPLLVSYEDCQNILANHFFKCENAGSEVRLYLEDSELENLIDGGVNTLVRAIGAECDRRGFRKITDLAESFSREWRDNYYVEDNEDDIQLNCDAPCPEILPVLVLLVYAVYFRDDKFEGNRVYYARLNKLLQEHELESVESLEPLSPESYDGTNGAWKCIENWSLLNNSKFGFFKAEPIKRYEDQISHVGYAFRQALLGSNRDRLALFNAFHKAGLTRSSSVSPVELFNIARRSGVSARMRNLLNKPTSDNCGEVLNEIRKIFYDWDYSFDYGLGNHCSRFPLRLMLRFDSTKLTDAILQSPLNIEEINYDDVAFKEKQTLPNNFPEAIYIKDGHHSKTSYLVNRDDESAWTIGFDWFGAVKTDWVFNGVDFSLCREEERYLVFEGSVSDKNILFEISKTELSSDNGYLLVCKTSDKQKPSFVGSFTDDWKDDILFEGVSCRPFTAKPPARSFAFNLDPTIKLEGGIKNLGERNTYIQSSLPRFVIDAPGLARDDFVAEIRVYDDSIIDRSKLHLAVYVDNNDISLKSIADLDSAAKGQSPFDFDIGTLFLHFGNLAIFESTPRVSMIQIAVSAKGKTITKDLFVQHKPLSGPPFKCPTRNCLGMIVDEDGENVSYQGLDIVGAGNGGAGFDFQDESIPNQICDHPVNRNTPGFKLMQYFRMSFGQKVLWSRARKDIPRMLGLDNEAVPLWHSLMSLHAMGIVEFVESKETGGSFDSIHAIKPTISMLPQKRNGGDGNWSFEALLLGCWLPKELGDLKHSSRQTLVWTESPRQDPLPPRMSLCCGATKEIAVKRFQEVADAVGVEFKPVPIAQSWLKNLGSIMDLPSSINLSNWLLGSPSTAAYHINSFNPRTLELSNRPLDPIDRYALLECKYHDRRIYKFFIVDQKEQPTKFFEIKDRQMARWFVRVSALRNIPVPVSNTQDLIVPTCLRLPKILERCLGIANGYRPEVFRFRELMSPFDDEATSSKFEIPPPVNLSAMTGSVEHWKGWFCRYRGFYNSPLWENGSQMPLLGALGERISLRDIGDTIT